MAKLVLQLISLLLLLSVRFQGCCGNTAANVEANLIQTLLTNYDVNARPIVNKSNPINVKIDVVLLQIINLDEREQMLETKVWQRVYWHDEFLTWNTSEHGGIERVTLNPTRIWRPHITLYEDMTQSPNDDSAAIYESTVAHDGSVEWYSPKLAISFCKVDVSFYPWDEQFCSLKFGSWTYDGASIDVFNVSTTGDMTYFSTSVEWSVLAFDVKKNTIYYNCCPNPFPDVTYTLHIRRKVMHYINTLILPSIFITSIALLVFFLPPESGEKISLSVTILLTLFVFMLFITEAVPKSDFTPRIGLYMQVLIGILSCSTALTVVTLRVHHHGAFGNKVPDWVRKVVLDWLARALCMKVKVDGRFPSPMLILESSVMPAPIVCNTGTVELVGVKAIQNGKPAGHNEEQDAESIAAAEKQQRGELQEACSQDWMLVAAVIDRLLLFIFIIVTVICSVVIFFHPFHSDIEPIS